MTRRLKSCVQAWPEASEGEYHPSCCRFPKSCSCTIYDEEYVTEDDLEDVRRERRRVLREGTPTTDGRLVQPGSIELPTLAIPVMGPATGPGHAGAPLVGALTALRREAGGWVTGYATLHEGSLAGWALEADLDNTGAPEMVFGLAFITRGRLRAVTLGKTPCWEGLIP